MKSIGKAILFGLLVWVIPFAVAMGVYPWRDSNRALFESVMAVVVALVAVVFGKLYLRKVEKNYFKEGMLLGGIFLVISIVIDLLMFSWGPMKMGIGAYSADIGLTYLMMPIITGGMGCLLSLHCGEQCCPWKCAKTRKNQ